MELTEHKAGNHHVIREITVDHVRIDQATYSTSLILGARHLDTEWPVTDLDQLDAEKITPLIELQPELVVIGIGDRQRLLDVESQRLFIEHGIGIECMTLAAAGRTFNVLMSENRRALAGLIFSG